MYGYDYTLNQGYTIINDFQSGYDKIQINEFGVGGSIPPSTLADVTYQNGLLSLHGVVFAAIPYSPNFNVSTDVFIRN